ncbi:hypothetical protein [Kribbella sp. NPDC004536]|uniref:hypothetical protein n=1 Tax=Kribbella sp. NPDC004536 TaxID=3364106 RepID=UPI0036BE1589
MPQVLLVRHGEADGSQLDDEGWWGPARELPLTAVDVDLREWPPDETRTWLGG